MTDIVQIPTIEGGSPKVKVRRFRHGATSISSDPLCSWPLGITRDECGECSIVMKGHPTHVTVQPARYSIFDPDRWWETRGGIRQ